VGQLLFVVSRDAVKRYQDLKRAFSDQESVDVILDRRVGERRGSGAQPVEASTERRRTSRRARPEVDSDLGSLGYSVVRLPALARRLSGTNTHR
jgi:hypothetical protein